MLLNEIVSSIIQILLFSIVPFVWWLITARKKESFYVWIGLKKASAISWKSLLVVTSLFIMVSVFTLYLTKDVETATSEFEGLGISALLPAFVYAVFHTSLPEELLFRGFLLKRLSHPFGFRAANIIQGLLFGLLHGAMFLNLAGLTRKILIIFVTSGIAFAMGYINEKKSGGSILPSWFIHATANLFAAVVAMFSLVQRC